MSDVVAKNKDPEQLAHQQWLGYVQPVGLVVSIPALLAAQAHVNRNIAPEHQRFLGCLCRGKRDELVPEIRDFPTFTQKVFGWEPADLVDMHGDDEAARSLEVAAAGIQRDAAADLGRPGVRAQGTAEAVDDARSRRTPSARTSTRPRPRRAALAGQPPGPHRAAAARDRSAHRPARSTARISAWFTPRAARPAVT